ncbi:nucleotidyltransferase [Vagococcus elongatus]|uniref:tRNA(Met) cytidine acetate ligase n=1 Tax=Vagococcus elongatus TaxID=180344 RepID=A0A430AQG3_9ENTE|nr:nucleotidyltransferase [Vagococcus elongatus]RSU10174.1 hypothetical protein CBF29_10325 [Vagococcus elongatus]
MRSCGIVAEYNPFHNGHRYQISKAKQLSQAEVMVAVMSGNFLQRGEPAIIDKWVRAELALHHGIDLVIELPFAYAVQSADYFSKGSIKLLQNLGTEALSFGTDYSGEIDYQEFAKFQLENQREIDDAFKKIQNNGMSYPQQMTEVYRRLYPEMTLDFNSPNHILGMGYAKENILHARPMELFPIPRKESEHHQTEITQGNFASGTSIRQHVKEKKWREIKSVLPEETFRQLKEHQTIDWELFWPLLKYQLTVQSTTQLRHIYQMTQGIENRLKKYVNEADSFKDFIEKVKTKRFTWTRLQRLCLYVLLQVTQEEVTNVWNNSYLRILAFNEKGQKYLNVRKNKLTLPVITNVNSQNESLLSLDIRAGQLFQLVKAEKKEQDYYTKPIMI